MAREFWPILIIVWPLVIVVLATAEPNSIPQACHARLEKARDELIARGFAPTSDKDTRRWLQVATFEGTLQLKLEMRTSADGAATFYSLDVHRPPRGVQPKPWRRHRGKYCCDEHAAAEDRLFEHRWTRSNARLLATVSVVEFEDERKDPVNDQRRDLFVEVARRAADDCLAL